VDEGAQARATPVGIGVKIQFLIPKHPNIAIGVG
jgi:hypothetical protein